MRTFSPPAPRNHSNQAHPRHISMPSCNDTDYKKNDRLQNIFVVYSIINQDLLPGTDSNLDALDLQASLKPEISDSELTSTSPLPLDLSNTLREPSPNANPTLPQTRICKICLILSVNHPRMPTLLQNRICKI